MVYTILYGHGSADRQWLDEFEEIRAYVAGRVTPETPVRSAFLQFVQPSLVSAAADAVREGATRLLIVPIFLFCGRHLRADVPEQVAEVRHRFPSVDTVVTDPIGHDPAFAALVASRVERSLAPTE